MPQKLPAPGAREIIHTIMERAITTPNETASVFVEHAAHIAGLHVRFYAGAWTQGADATWTETVYLDEHDDDTLQARLLAILNRLASSLEQPPPDSVITQRIQRMVADTIAAFVPPAAPEESHDRAPIPLGPCACCATLCDGEWTIEADNGDELPLCDIHGGPDAPDITTIRALIAQRQPAPLPC